MKINLNLVHFAKTSLTILSLGFAVSACSVSAPGGNFSELFPDSPEKTGVGDFSTAVASGKVNNQPWTAGAARARLRLRPDGKQEFVVEAFKTQEEARCNVYPTGNVPYLQVIAEPAGADRVYVIDIFNSKSEFDTTFIYNGNGTSAVSFFERASMRFDKIEGSTVELSVKGENWNKTFTVNGKIVATICP